MNNTPSGYNIFKDSLRQFRKENGIFFNQAQKLKDKEQELFAYLGNITQDEPSEKPLFYKPNFSAQGFNMQSQPLTEEITKKMQSRFIHDEHVDMKLNQFLESQFRQEEEFNVENQDYLLDQNPLLQDVQNFDLQSALDQLDCIQKEVKPQKQFDDIEFEVLKNHLDSEINRLKEVLAKKTKADFSDLKSMQKEFKSVANPLMTKDQTMDVMNISSESQEEDELEDDDYIAHYRNQIKGKKSKSKKNNKKQDQQEDEGFHQVQKFIEQKKQQKEERDLEKQKVLFIIKKLDFDAQAMRQFKEQIELEKEIQRKKQEERERDLQELKKLNDEQQFNLDFMKEKNKKNFKKNYKNNNRQMNKHKKYNKKCKFKQKINQRFEINSRNSQFLLEYNQQQEEIKKQEEEKILQQKINQTKEKILEMISIDKKENIFENILYQNQVDTIPKNILQLVMNLSRKNKNMNLLKMVLGPDINIFNLTVLEMNKLRTKQLTISQITQYLIKQFFKAGSEANSRKFSLLDDRICERWNL